MIDVVPLLISLFMATACPECEAANSRNMNDIAATPSGNDGADSDASSAPVMATRWGAVATGDGAMGVAEMFDSREAAERKAMQDCQDSAPGAVCTVRITYFNQCVAVSWGDAGSTMSRGPDRTEVEAASLANCRERSSNCDVLYSSCSYPEWIG